jgi:hypothetical protein
LARLDSDSVMTIFSSRCTSSSRAAMRWALAAKASDLGFILERSVGMGAVFFLTKTVYFGKKSSHDALPSSTSSYIFNSNLISG